MQSGLVEVDSTGDTRATRWNHTRTGSDPIYTSIQRIDLAP